MYVHSASVPHSDHPLRCYDRTCPACNAGMLGVGSPIPVAWLTQSGNPVRADQHDMTTALAYGWKPLYEHPPANVNPSQAPSTNGGE